MEAVAGVGGSRGTGQPLGGGTLMARAQRARHGQRPRAAGEERPQWKKEGEGRGGGAGASP